MPERPDPKRDPTGYRKWVQELEDSAIKSEQERRDIELDIKCQQAEAESNKRLLKLASDMLESGLYSPQQVGQMLMGDIQPANNNIICFHDFIMAMQRLSRDNQTQNQYAGIRAKQDKIDRLKHNPEKQPEKPKSLSDQAKEQGLAIRSWHETMTSLGLIPSMQELRIMRQQAEENEAQRYNGEIARENERHRFVMEEHAEKRQQEQSFTKTINDGLEKAGSFFAEKWAPKPDNPPDKPKTPPDPYNITPDISSDLPLIY